MTRRHGDKRTLQRRWYFFIYHLATIIVSLCSIQIQHTYSLSSLLSYQQSILSKSSSIFGSDYYNNNNGIKRIPINGRYSNMTISSLGCGTWSWGNRLLYNYNDQTDDDSIYEAYKIVRTAGVTLFDTADSYGTLNYNGRAEFLLGKFERTYMEEQQNQQPNNVRTKKLFSLSTPSWFSNWGMVQSGNKNNNNNNRQVATKLAPYPWRLSRTNIVSACKGSLRRIHEDKVTIAQTHWSTANYLPYQERVLWEGLGDLYEQNYCDAVGVSNYGPKQLQKIIYYLSNEHTTKIPVATAQIQYSLLTYADPITRSMKECCDDNNVRLIAYSPLCLGLLSGKYTIDNINTIPSLARRQLFRELLPNAKHLLQTLNMIAMEQQKSMSQIAINWTVCKGTIPIPGCRTPIQAQQTIDSVCGWKLKPSEVDELDRIAISIKKPMIQNIFQTK